MNFVDEVTMIVKAGDGGRGCVSFLREKFRPWGGPNGGNGGNGGDVILCVDPQRNTLLELAHRHHVKAARGDHGRGKDQHGKNAKSLILPVPAGTIARDVESGEILADLRAAGQAGRDRSRRKRRKRERLFCHLHQSGPSVRPARGCPERRRQVQLELRLLADVGLVGFPKRREIYADLRCVCCTSASCRLSLYDPCSAPRRCALWR